MPSFSLLKRSPRETRDQQQLPRQHPPQVSHEIDYGKGLGSTASGGVDRDGASSIGGVSSVGGSTTLSTTKERRRSGRDLLQSLINRSMGKPPHQQQQQAGAETPQQHQHQQRRYSQRPGQQQTQIVNGGSSNSTLVDRHQATPTSPRKQPLPPPLLSPRSPINANKPLPSPPPLDPSDLLLEKPLRPVGAAASPATPKPVLKLNRIMPTLSEADVEKLFSGAPQFFARSEGHYTGAPHPSVAFPWDESLEIRDLTDHTQIEDAAWGCVTAWPHIITRGEHHAATGAGNGQASTTTRTCRKRAHFYPRCRERPNMLSMQGLEKGTVGYQAALEMAVADALQEEQFGFGGTGLVSPVIVEQRKKLLTSKDGPRHLDETTILEQLHKNGRRYDDDGTSARQRRSISSELYNELFLYVLHPPSRVLDHHDPYSLSVQIQALVKVLATPNIWVDFSHVESRIRLGQMLWGSSSCPPIGDHAPEAASSTGDAAAETEAERQEERYWLLLQILLACELLVRLDAITEGEELGVESIRPQEVLRFEREASPSVKWSIHLARAWLENIELVKADQPAASAATPAAEAHHGGWLAHLAGRMSLLGGHDNNHQRSVSATSNTSSSSRKDHKRHGSNQHHPGFVMKGKHGRRQVDGLTHFAGALRWPDMEHYAARISENCRPVIEGTTPLASPQTGDGGTSRSSYFGGNRRVSLEAADRTPTTATPATTVTPGGRRRRTVAASAALRPSGWLSKSYMSGLVLPGEGLGHFLMSTLLENDRDAMARLGPLANLCGGFVYAGKSFWSTACIVGRVLAAGRGAAECMGWVSSDVTPQGLGDGWLNIEVQELKEDSHHVGKRARLWGKAAIERESAVLGDADPSSVLPADFIIPFENIYPDGPPPSLRVELRSLNLFAPVDSVHTTPTDERGGLMLATPFSDASTVATRAPPEIHTYPAAVAFSVVSTNTTTAAVEEREYTFALANDIQFVTAHPCVPSQHVRILKSPSSPTIQQIDVSGSGFGAMQSSPPTTTTTTQHTLSFSSSLSWSSSASPSRSHPHFAAPATSKPATVTGHPLHKFYTYTAVHLSELLARPGASLEDFIGRKPQPQVSTSSSADNSSTTTATATAAAASPHRPSLVPSARSKHRPPTVLVVDCITGLQPAQRAADLPPMSPVLGSTSSWETNADAHTGDGTNSTTTTAPAVAPSPTASSKMHAETRRRQFGSDAEVLVRALCAERGWNAIVSRRRRGCLACAIREAGALGWKVVVRVD